MIDIDWLDHSLYSRLYQPFTWSNHYSLVPRRFLAVLQQLVNDMANSQSLECVLMPKRASGFILTVLSKFLFSLCIVISAGKNSHELFVTVLEYGFFLCKTHRLPEKKSSQAHHKKKPYMTLTILPGILLIMNYSLFAFLLWWTKPRMRVRK